MPSHLPYSQACENNKAPILEKLHQIFDTPGKVLEIGSLTGQHAVHFAQAMPHLQWQPTDHPDAADTCRPRLAQAALPNVLPVIALDVSDPDWPVDRFTWAFSANTAHIMAWNEVEQMFRQIGKRLLENGAFCLYGPFNQQGQYSSESNRQFDRHLRAQAPAMGIRDLDDIDRLAEEAGLMLADIFDMPANNRLLVFRLRKTAAPLQEV
ncbi:DUF938 domain-containing protein [Marinobacter confluentis]|uniref:DUF938 domain-containing protein n=1 Tax=Marinobacter confluentis TaxID=1697557 RepID=A0A4Z1BSV2_9GAMM|nr:DUF938 domain-containing protein [Marinobacter confluentis]TGN40259.1 DUF938 domain-containing protein [Marinobacter confluentis]